MLLTPKQEAFANCVADGMTQADAYRASFDVAETTKPESVQVSASRLMADPNIKLRVKELRDKLAEASIWSRLDSVTTLSEIAKGHDEQGKTSDRVSAVKELNSMMGWSAPSKTELTIKQKQINELDDDELARIASGN